MTNNINSTEENNLLDLKIKISYSEEEKDYSQSLKIPKQYQMIKIIILIY